MSRNGSSLQVRIAFVTTLFLLQACSTHEPVPIEERRVSEELQHAVTTAPDVYTVKSGDSLYAIAFRYGLDYREVARWNRIQVTELIQPGQQLKLSEPPAQKGFLFRFLIVIQCSFCILNTVAVYK